MRETFIRAKQTGEAAAPHLTLSESPRRHDRLTLLQNVARSGRLFNPSMYDEAGRQCGAVKLVSRVLGPAGSGTNGLCCETDL
jgi:hypothetical protein